MGRKNRRNRKEYHAGLNINPAKYVTPISRKGYVGRTPKRGDVWFADLGWHLGTSVIAGCRPVLIVSNDIRNIHAETLNILPITSRMKKLYLSCHMEIDLAFISDLQQNCDISMILAEQITTIDKSQLRNYVGRVEDRDLMESIDTLICRQLGLAIVPQR